VHARPRSRLAASDAALWAAVGLAITPRLLMFSRRIFIDIYISMFMALTLLFFVLAERFPGRRRLFLALMYGAVGLGVLTKGPVAAALPALVFGVYLLLFGELSRVTRMMIPTGTLIVLAIVLPWYGAVYARHGWDYITAFFLGENVARFTDGVGVESSRGPLFYLPVVFSDSFPWSMFLFASAAAWIARRREDLAIRDAGFRVRTLLWLWVVVIVVFFSLSAAKQDLYIFPIVPAVAALGGLAASRGGSPATYTALTIGALLALIAAGVLVLFNADSTAYSLEGAAALGWLGLGGGVAVIVLASLKRPHAALLAVAATFTALNWVFVVKALPSFERYKPVPGFARTLQSRLAPDDVVATYDEALPSLVYYLGRHVEQLFLEEQMIAVFGSGRTVYAVLSTGNYARLTDALGVPTCIIDRRPTFDVKLKTVLARGPLPELVLITNRCR
jgi:4-amino-4-deoxy-L-arabinose transferase-like glycosyltransferase